MPNEKMNKKWDVSTLFLFLPLYDGLTRELCPKPTLPPSKQFYYHVCPRSLDPFFYSYSINIRLFGLTVSTFHDHLARVGTITDSNV